MAIYLRREYCSAAKVGDSEVSWDVQARQRRRRGSEGGVEGKKKIFQGQYCCPEEYLGESKCNRTGYSKLKII